jgi:hypothetical protein
MLPKHFFTLVTFSLSLCHQEKGTEIEVQNQKEGTNSGLYHQ